MNILIIRNYPSYMDVLNNTYNIQEIGLAKALIRKNNRCDILFWTDKEEKDVDLNFDGGVVHVYYRHGKTALKNTVFTSCDSIIEKYDVLQTAEYNQMQSWLCAKKYQQKAIIYHGPYYSSFNKRYNLMCSVFDKFFLKRYLKLNTHFLVKSELAKDFLVQKGIHEENITVAGVGIDTQMLSNVGEACEESIYLKMRQYSGKKILYIGRFEERRNIPFILHVFKKVKQINPDTKLFLIGNGDNDYLDAVWKIAKELNIFEDIEYQQQLEQKYMAEIYKLADCFMLPTHYEIFGMVLLEAMFYGNIVYTTNNGGSSTLIENGKNGFIFDSFNSDEWCKKIVDIFDNKKLRDDISEMATKTISTHFTWDALSESFVSAYELVGESKK
ncbi:MULTISPECIES: glycosyltransferase family 4 protein [unclassified Butyrivibrio]|uniref:glycosyltransferase family 4 protein n=1 Tax=unclassified Butyrivibrio TaxID=2639466 RepID=UPI0003F79887|nr:MULTISPECIES: glycosyltransferase family 4 protein [unclassified Butyrivibrio]